MCTEKVCVACGYTFSGRRCPECKKRSNKEDYLKNKARYQEQKKIRYLQKAEEIKAKALLWKEEHKEYSLAYSRNWAKANKDKRLVYNAKRRFRNRGTLRSDLISVLLISQDSKCVYCKTDISESRHLDHIFPLALGGLNEDSNMQLLCPRCNLQKGAKHPVDFMNSIGVSL